MRDPLDVFESLGDGPAFIWEDARRSYVGANPRRALILSKETDDPIGELRRALASFSGTAIGFLGYGVARWLERLPDRHPPQRVPEAVVMFFDDVKSFERTSRNRENAKTRNESAEWVSNCTREQFEQAVVQAKEQIAAGEAFQIVVSQRWETPFPGAEAAVLYRTLRELNPSPYMFLLRGEDFTLVGSSPEMLVRVTDRLVETRPIAGTRPRGNTPQDDAALEAELLANEKENAEHLMLVDLGRNDVGRVSERGSVNVTEFRTIERYSHVMHLVSHVTGTLRKDTQPVDALLAAFPAGTVTGAPKIRAMELIDELEFSRRGPYAGTVLFSDNPRNLDSCINIRSVLLHNDRAYVQAGAGIVFDSDPAREYEETVNKAAAMKDAVESCDSVWRGGRPRPPRGGRPRAAAPPPGAKS